MNVKEPDGADPVVSTWRAIAGCHTAAPTHRDVLAAAGAPLAAS